MIPNPNEAVISGIAGKFPECFSVDELKDKLLTKSILTKPDTVRNLPPEVEISNFTSGKVPEGKHFDNVYFRMLPILVKNTDPMFGMMIEKTFEAIVDAGYNPSLLRGRNIAVLAAPSPSDLECLGGSEVGFGEGIGIVASSRAMMSNRISFSFNFIGTSVSTEGSWVSGMQCLERASEMVSAGLVEAAIVVSANTLIHTSFDVGYLGLGLTSDDGVCKPFDDDAHGCVRSESAVVLYIQRYSDAKRVYGTVKKVRTNFMGNRDTSYLQIAPHIDISLRNFYNDLSERPEDVSYIEAHGICLKEADEKELNAVAEVFCNQKKTPQLIGSITGNVGNADNCAGLVATVKALKVLDTGVIPPTVNYQTPNSNVPALVSGQLKPVTEETELPGGLVAVNNLSWNGSFSHALFQRHDKAKKEVLGPKDLPKDGLPRLVLLQGRRLEAAKAACEKVSSMAVDVEFVSLVNNVFKHQIQSYMSRGYTVIPTLEDNPIFNFQEYNSTKRPLWFVFSGMGSQWSGMGKQLLQFPVFKSSIEKCNKVLRPKGIDLVHILSSDDATIFDNILNSFVGITATQIGLVDILTELGVTPDGIIGHSVGELGCAYADGCFTAEETILAAYSRGKASVDSLDNDYIKGMMAAVGLGYHDIKDKLPPSIDVACHNSRDSCTLSGPTDDINSFVDKLKTDKVFARSVSAGGIAYHSRYIKSVAPKMLKLLEEVVPNPKRRSSKWISTSVPEDQWNTDAAKLCSPEYLTNNLLNPVYFEEGCKHLPDDAILLEIAPHGLLQAILRRSVSSSSTNLALTSRTAKSNLDTFLKCLGELHLNGVDIDVNALYPKVDYPVSRETPSLAPLISWDHDTEHYQEFIAILNMYVNKKTCEKEVRLHPTVVDYKLWKDHCMQGQVVLSPVQILMYPWEMILNLKSKKIEQYHTIIEDVTICGNIPVNEMERVLSTTLSPTSLKFEVFCNMEEYFKPNTIIMTGKVMEWYEQPKPLQLPNAFEDLSTMQEMSATEVYHTFSELGWDLGPTFQNIKKLYMGKKGCIAKLNWNGNFTTFLDSLMKIVVFFKSHGIGILQYPNSFTKLTVDGSFLSALPLESEVEVHYQDGCNRVICQGAELLGLSLKPVGSTDVTSLAWSQFKFQPYFDSKIKTEDFLSHSVQTAAEDGFKSWGHDLCKINILILNSLKELLSYQYKHMFKNNLKSRPNIEVRITQVDSEEAKKQVGQMVDESVILVGDYNSVANLASRCGETVNLYCVVHCGTNSPPDYGQTLRPVSVCQTGSGKLTLLKRVPPQSKVHIYQTESHDWLSHLRTFVEGEKNDLITIVVTQSLSPRQVLSALAKESFAPRIRTFFIQDRDARNFSLSAPFYSSQLSLGLSVNILSGGVWGSLRSTSLTPSPCNLNPNNLVSSLDENLSINCVSLNTQFYTVQQEPLDEEPELKYLDYSGVVKGQRVMGLAYVDPDSNTLRPDPVLEWPVPVDWTMEEAATVPALYALAYYCVNVGAYIERGPRLLNRELLKGERVLIHAGMSPLGQALIAVVLDYGGEVIASVLDEKEVLLLTQQFPAIKSDRVFVLGKEDINVAVKKLLPAGDKKVQVVFSCLQGQDFQSSARTVDNDSRFINLAENKIEDKETLGLGLFLGGMISVYGVSMRSVEMSSEDFKMELKEALKNGIDKGIVKPLRKRSFHLPNLTDAICNLQTRNVSEKTLLSLKNEKQTTPQNGNFQCDMDSFHIIAGANVELKFSLAEWLIHHGARKIILVNEEIKGSRYLRRINRILHRGKCSTVMVPSTCLESVESAVRFLKETSRIGSVSSIFCISMDENCNKMKNLDTASRQILPGLQQFVSLLGSGTTVCDSRANSGLPVCSIQGERSLETSGRVLPYLFTLMTDSAAEAKFFLVSDNFGASMAVQEETDTFPYLPNSVEDLFAYGESVEARPQFVEEVTRSPPYSVAKRCLLPVFMIPGVGHSSVKPLLKQLMHPTFCCRLPADPLPTDQLADIIVQEIRNIQTQGPYNIVGESWGGALALTVGCLLEAQGHGVNLILVQGIPTTVQSRLRALCRRQDADLGHCVLNAALKVQGKNVSHGSWRERLEHLLPTLEPDVREPVSRAVNALNNQLKSFLQFQLSKEMYKGDITLIHSKNETLPDLEALFKKFPTIMTVDESSHSQLLASFTTASAINENMAYTWKL